MTVSIVETNPSDFTDYAALYGLLTETYAFMAGRIDPPSFLTNMTVADIAAKARAEDLYLIRQNGRPVACMFGRPVDGGYEVGKVAVAAAQRRRGHARHMMETAADHARRAGFDTLRLYARIELTENHDTYRAMGFEVLRPFSHPGFDRPTAYIFQRAL